MKGIMFNVFEDFVVQNWGEDFYEDILESSTLATLDPFVAPGTYPDADLIALVGTTVTKLGIPLRDALVAFGSFAFDGLVKTNPAFVDEHTDIRSFLATVDSIIHIEVRKLYPDAVTPTVLVEERAATGVQLTYRSERKLCPVVEGLVTGAARRFGLAANFSHPQCMNDGAAQCVFDIDFSPVEG